MPGDQGIALRVLDRLHGEIDIEVGPVEMVKLRPLHVQDCGYRGVPKPGENVEGEKQLPISQQEPEAVLRNIGDLSVRSALSENSWSHEGMLAEQP